MHIIAREIFEMHVPRNLLPFVLPPSGSPDGGLDPEDLTICTSLTPPDDSMEPIVPFEFAPFDVTDPVLPAAETTASDLPASSNDSKQLFPADSLYTQEEINAAEALLLTFTGPVCTPISASHTDQELTIFP